VVFEGKDVLEGLRRLVALGLTSGPLPDHLTQVASFGQNSFYLDEM
jgi:hypothetical protein